MSFESLLLEFQRWSLSFSEEYGYLGIFIVCLIGSSSVGLPIPTFAAVIALGAVMNPFLVGLFAGLGDGLGEAVGYFVGKGGEKLLKKKYEKEMKDIEEKVKRFGLIPLIFAFAMTPLPDDFLGVFCGLTNYSFRKYMVTVIAGKIFFNTLIAVGAHYGFQWVVGG